MAATISKSPVQSVSDTWDCSVCFEPICSQLGQKVIGKCTHIFHEACINRWLPNSKKCPECRSDWEVVLITDATDAAELMRVLMRHHAEKEEKKKQELEAMQEQISAREKELVAILEAAPTLPKKPLGELLEQFSEKQLRSLSDKIGKTGRLWGNLQTFVRDLFNENRPNCKEADELWAYFRKKKEDKDIIYQILATCSERYYTSIEQLKKVCIWCGIPGYEMDRIIKEVKEGR